MVKEDAIDDGVAANERANEEFPGNRVRWGELVGVEAIRAEVNAAHSQITTWKNNFFELPRNAGVSKEVGDDRSYSACEAF